MRQSQLYLTIITASLLYFFSTCTPKATEQVTEVPVREKVTVPVDPDIFISECGKFIDSDDADAASDAHVIYRGFLKGKNMEEAFPHWKKAYTMAPAADGQRDYHFIDGGKLYYHKFQQTEDEELRQGYIDTIKNLYLEAAGCFPKNEMIYKGLLAFDMYYKFNQYISKDDNLKLFQEVIDANGIESPDFIVNPFTALLIERFDSNAIDMAEAQQYAKMLLKIMENGTAKCKGKACDRWKIINSYAPVRLSEFEREKGFYDSEYYIEKYMPEFLEDSTDCDVITTTYTRLKWGGCDKDSPEMSKVSDAYDKNCRVAVTPSTPKCRGLLEGGQITEACDCYETKGREQNNAKYLLTAAKIQYGNLKNYSRARQLARAASDIDPAWGDPYLLVGKLYASSGAKCGPGTGFDSQRVVWVAIDEWRKAAKDPNTAPKANKLIQKYTQYMPKKEDIFFRNIAPGSSYKVPCWIQQNTRVRTSD